MAEREEELKRLLMKVNEEIEKADLKLNIEKTKIRTSSSVANGWEKRRNSGKFYFLELQNHCRW